MLNRWTIRFTLKLTSPTHVGDGRKIPLSELRAENSTELSIWNGSARASDEAVETSGYVRTVQRGVIEVESQHSGRQYKPVLIIEASSLRGAFRSIAGENADYLFGPEQIDEGNTASGAIWVNAAFAATSDVADYRMSEEELKAAKSMPFWSNEEQTYILTGNRIDRDTGTVEDGHLYLTEFVPAGFCFKAELVFEGDKDELISRCIPLLQEISHARNLQFGSGQSLGMGAAIILPDSLQIEMCAYDPLNQSFETESFDRNLEVSDNSKSFDFALEMECEGPFFIQDPYARTKGEYPENNEVPDMLPLGGKTHPLLGTKAVLQELRKRTAWLETIEWLEDANNSFNYQAAPFDDMSKVLTAKQDPKGGLTRTERLFGVTGWGKVVEIFQIEAATASAVYHGHGLQIDTFTQAPMDGALVEFDVPAQVSAKFGIRLARERYAGGLAGELQADFALLERAVKSLAQPHRAPSYGHSTRTGFGLFRVNVAPAEQVNP